MMRVHVVTLFPEMFGSVLRAGILGKAVAAGHVEVCFTSPRDFTSDRHKTVDDTPYGGGSGMVMMPGPLVDALESLPAGPDGAPPRRILMTPQGKPFQQSDAMRLSAFSSIALVCGRYEGVDERVREFVDEEISLGDFVLLGGEVAAMAILEAVIRLLPGVLGNETSAEDESHVRGLLEYPQYTRPAEFRGLVVPEVLRSGDHGKVARFRRKESLARTRARRPDLFAKLALDAEDRALLEELQAEERASESVHGAAALLVPSPRSSSRADDWGGSTEVDDAVEHRPEIDTDPGDFDADEDTDPGTPREEGG
jgi:tRNA (guanine37-N1)-methyltransferase